MAPGLSRPPAPPTGGCGVAMAPEPFPSAVRGWREAEAGGEAEPPRFQTAAKAPRRVWAPGHGLRREQVQTWPRCSPRGAQGTARSGGRWAAGQPATPRPRRLPRWARLLSAVRRRFPQGRGVPGANRCRPALPPSQPLPPSAAARRGVPSLMTPLARPVAFPVGARLPSPASRQPEDGGSRFLGAMGRERGEASHPLRKPPSLKLQPPLRAAKKNPNN